MADHILVAVVLPAGLAPHGTLRANLYLTPRLSGAAQLAAFADWLDWPDLVKRNGLTFTLTCGSKSVEIDVDANALRPDVWREIFTPHTPVAEYPRTDFDRRLLVSYPVRDAYAYLKYAYQTIGANLGAQTLRRTFESVLADLAFRDERGSTLDATLANLRVQMWQAQQAAASPGASAGSTTPSNAPEGAATTLTPPANTRPMIERFALVNRMPDAPKRKPLPHSAADFADLLDFHKALTALYAYPALARALGLIFEVELPASLCAPSPASSATGYATIAVHAITPGWTWHMKPQIGFPSTAYWRDATRFDSAPATPPAALKARQYAPGDVLAGFLALDAQYFQLIGVDLDGALLKLMSLADSFAFGRAGDALETTLPALRSSGLSLIANGRAQQLLQTIRDNQAFNDALLPGGAAARPFDARDLTRGYRLDVWSSQTGIWHSLHRRDGAYRFGENGALSITTDDEEGFTQLAVAQPADDPTRADDPVAMSAGAPQPGTDLYVHERVARWNGWSLSAPRPGNAMNRSADPSQATDPDPTAQQPLTPFKMVATFTPHRGSLPRLRYGKRFRMRARVVDLAGRSVALDAATPLRAVAPANGQRMPYLRYEAVPAPNVVLRALPGAGGSQLALVIRSRNSDPSLDSRVTGEIDERHIAPPQAAVLMVEHHGMLDDAKGHLKSDAATYRMIVARDKGTFAQIGNVAVESGAQIDVPYFPDPIARGAALANLPNALDGTDGRIGGANLTYVTLPDVEPRAGSVTFVGFGDAWPARRAFRLRLIEGNRAPQWDDAARVLTVSVPKAAVATVPLGSYVDPADLELLGVWNWLREWFEAAEQEAMAQNGDAGAAAVGIGNQRALLTRLVLDGAQPLITPQTILTLTHATQQPLERPAWWRLPIQRAAGLPPGVSLSNRFAPITAWRSRGSHHAVLFGALKIHGASTAALDLQAVWREWIDDPDAPGPVRTPGAAHVERIDLVSLEGGALAADAMASRYVATYLPGIDTLWFAAPQDQLTGVDSPGNITAPVHQLGDTKHRRVRYQAVASSRFQEYFPEPGLVFTRTSAPLAVDVPSSARPLVPEISYVLPVFGWERQTSSNVKSEIRVGNGVRVYLKRPWFSSGDGELLGVVLWPEAQAAPDDATRETIKALITQWGLDPLWETGALAAMPDVGQFPLAVRSTQRLALQESAQPVDVAGHRVAYDETRALWFCDIALDNPSAYMPFVRFALARYQPHSIAGTELSQVALADFAQLSADRSATLGIDPADPRRARLFVGGIAPGGPTRPVILVSVQTRDPKVDSDLGWIAPAVGVVDVIEDSPAPSQPDAVLWSGTIVFARTPPGGRFRVVIREYELLEIDPPMASLSDQPAYGERLVYASILPFDFPF